MKNYFNEDTPLLAIIIALIVVLGILFGAVCFEAWIVMLLWNWIVPLLWIDAPLLTFWTAVGIDLLISILFGACRIKSKKD